MNKLYFWFLIVLGVPYGVSGQSAGDYRTAQNGNWNNVNTWQVYNGGSWNDLNDPGAGVYQNVIPSSASGEISIRTHEVDIPAGYFVTIDQTTVSAAGRLDVETSGTLNINAVADALVVNGDLIARDLSAITGATAARVVFNAGSNYYHYFTATEGVIPTATWNSTSNLIIRGYTTFTTATSAGHWSQSFGNVQWRCSSQANTISLAGLLTTIGGDLEVLDTNGQQLRFSTNQHPTINIAGDFNVEGNSVIAISTTGTTATTVNVQGNFNFDSTSGLDSYLTTTGTTAVNVYGDFSMDAGTATLNLAFSTTSSGTGTLNIRGDFNLVSGTIKEGNNDSATSTGRIWFTNTGTGKQHDFTNTGTISNRINYRLSQSTDTLRIVGQSQLIGNTGSALTVIGGTIITENTDTNGAIQTGSGTGNGSIRVATRSYGTGTTFIYSGLSTQYIGNGHASTVNAVIDNSSGVELNNATAATVTMGGLYLKNGDLLVENDNLSITATSGEVDLEGGDLILSSSVGVRSVSVQAVNLNGGNIIVNGAANAATFTINGDLTQNVGDITINSGTGDATLRLYADFTGTGGNFYFTGDNCRLLILGAGAFSRSIPITEATTLKFVRVDRAGETVMIPEALIVTTNVSIVTGTLQVNDLLVMEDLNVGTGGILNFTNSTLELQAQFNSSFSGGTLYANSLSNLLLTGTGAVGTLVFDAGGNSLSKLVLDRPTTGTLLTLNSTLNVYDSVRLSDGIFNNISGLNVQADLNFLRNSGASMTGVAPGGGPYNLIYQGTTLTSASESQGSLQNLTSEVSGTVTLANSINMTGELLISSGTFTSGVNTIVAGLFTNNSTFNAPSTTLTLAGDFTNNSIFNANSGTVSFDGIATIGGTSSTVFQSMSITAQGDVTPPSTLELKGNFTNDGTYNHANGLIVLSGTSRQDLSGSSTTRVYNMNVTNATSPYSVSVDGDVELQGTLTLSAGAQFLADGVTTNGVFTVLSLDDQPSTVDGRIATIPASAAVLGDITVQRFMIGKTKKVNRYISSPVTGATVSQITSDYPVEEVKWYDETVTGNIDNGYVVASATDVLESGRGYLALPTTANVTATWDVRGPLTTGQNQGSVTFTVTHTDSNPVDVNGDGWNLLGNPYPSGIGWGINSGWTRSNIGATIYVRDQGGPSPFYKTWTYNGADGTGNLPNGVIAMGQAFWVWANTGGGTLIVNENAKTSMNGTFYRERGPQSKQLILALKNQNGDEDYAFLKTNSAASEDFDPDFDAHQLKNEVLNISIFDKASRPLTMHTLSSLPDDFAAPVEISVASPGEYTIAFDYAQEFLGASELYLVDEVLQIATPIHVGGASYTFNVPSAGRDHSRFSLKRKAEFNTAEFSVRCYPNPASDRLFIERRGRAETATAVIMDMKGTVMAKASVERLTELNIAHLPAGMYIVRVVTPTATTVAKIIKD